jgi:hypothetical protein
VDFRSSKLSEGEAIVAAVRMNCLEIIDLKGFKRIEADLVARNEVARLRMILKKSASRALLYYH